VRQVPWPRLRSLLSIIAVLLSGQAAEPMAQTSGATSGSSAANATIAVTPGAVDDIINQNCSLVEAIIAANTDEPRDACPAGSGADTVHAPGRFVLIAVPGATKSRTGLPAITSAITILNARISRDAAAPAFRILHVDGGDLTLVNVGLSGGSAVDCPDGGAAVCAGGILNTGVLSLINTRVVDNTASGIGPIDGGAGIVNAGTATLANSSVSGNVAVSSAAAVGGGITNNAGATLTLTNSQLRDNTATAATGAVAAGGGLANFGTAGLTTSRVLGNTAVAPDGTAMGGGIYQENGSTSLIRTRVSGNAPDDCQPAISGCG
jgi:hypothetical protein